MAATLKVDTITNASNAGTANLTLDASGNATVGNTLVMGSSFKRNRIINGDMRVDQRNAGASVTQAASVSYIVDRWWVYGSSASKFTAQRSTVAPAGFANSVVCTSSSAYSVTGTDEFDFAQYIEGFNIADLGWGSANAKSVTLSFWVRSSLTGSFGGQIANYNSSRSYPFPYTISAANTWEYKTVTIPGDTTGTWYTDNQSGILVLFSLGASASKSGTASTWAAGNYTQPTGSTSVVGTNGATFYITGVQLEVGSVATPYERQIYSDQLAQCQRYYYRITNSNPFGFAVGVTTNSKSRVVVNFPVTMRAAPSALEQSGTATDYAIFFAGAATNCSAVPTFLSATPFIAQSELTTTAGVTAGQGGLAYASAAAAYLGWSAEL